MLAFVRGVAVGELEPQNEDGVRQQELRPVVVPARKDWGRVEGMIDRTA